eukprot:7656154-Heterocapsa_arctica.AAC.1
MTLEEELLCRPNSYVTSQCGQTRWNICNQANCYGCYFKTHAVADLMTNDFKEETIVAIGSWRQKPHWTDLGADMKIEHIAGFLATRPKQRRILIIFGAVRLSRTEARNIILHQKKAYNFFATVAVNNFIYLDDIMIPVDQESMAFASALELYLEYGSEQLATIFDNLEEILNAISTLPWTILNQINRRTKADIMLSILGLGHIFREQRHPELQDMPDMINLLETELRKFDMDDYTHQARGQYPED